MNFVEGIISQYLSNYPYDSEVVIGIILKLLNVAIEIDETVVPMEIASEYVNYVKKDLRALNRRLLGSPKYGLLLLVLGIILE